MDRATRSSLMKLESRSGLISQREHLSPSVPTALAVPRRCVARIQSSDATEAARHRRPGPLRGKGGNPPHGSADASQRALSEASRRGTGIRTEAGELEDASQKPTHVAK